MVHRIDTAFTDLALVSLACAQHTGTPTYLPASKTPAHPVVGRPLPSACQRPTPKPVVAPRAGPQAERGHSDRRPYRVTLFCPQSELRQMAYIKTAAQRKYFTEIGNRTSPAMDLLQVREISRALPTGRPSPRLW